MTTNGLWVPSHVTLGGHRKTRKLARRLKLSIPTTVGHLTLLWHYALVHAEDGNLSKHDPEDIAIASHFDGKPADFRDALVAAGFVDRTKTRLRLHDWGDFGGRYLRSREQRRQAAETRWHGATAMRPHSDRNAPGMQSRGDKTREQRARGGDEDKDLKAWLSSEKTKDGDQLHPLAVEHAIRRVGEKHFDKPKAAALKIARDEHHPYASEQAEADRRHADAERTAACKRCNGEGQVWLDEEETTRSPCPECRAGAAS